MHSFATLGSATFWVLKKPIQCQHACFPSQYWCECPGNHSLTCTSISDVHQQWINHLYIGSAV